MARLLCIDQTVESSEEAIPDGLIRDHLLGHVVALAPLDAVTTEVCVSFPLDLLGRTAGETLHLLFGTSSLKPGIRLVDLDVPAAAPVPWQGPRFGRDGLRRLVNVPARPLACAVLKPLGRSPKELAALAYAFARGGVDCVKDDQGLMDQPFSPLADRIAACADAVARANRETGRRCLYVAHLGCSLDDMVLKARLAKARGAGGLLLCPGLIGYDTIQRLAADPSVGLPLFSHPALLGTYALHPTQGIAPAMLYGVLPRLFGADVTIYPTWGPEFGMTKTACAEIALATGSTRLRVAATFPTAAGRIDEHQIADACALYGRDVLFILGSRIQADPSGIQQACRRFMDRLEAVGERHPD